MGPIAVAEHLKDFTPKSAIMNYGGKHGISSIAASPWGSGLILTIVFVRNSDSGSVAAAVALFITAGYWFTSSTSFANPAVTLARTFTDTFTGISPESIIYFFSGQLVGLFIAFYIYKFLR